MKVFVSSLIRDLSEMTSVAEWVDSLGHEDIGVELIAFTHLESYWHTLCGLLKKLRCPVTFHGPFIGVEGTSAPGTQAHSWLMESYRRVFQLARTHNVRHIVYHTTQLPFRPEQVKSACALAEENLSGILAMAEEMGVSVLIENLSYPRMADRVPLYTSTAYGSFFTRHPNANSIIDIGHAHMNAMDLPGFLQQHGDRVKAYHFHNNDGEQDMHSDIFSGTFSYNDFAPIYRQYTPNADIVLEYEPHVALDNKALHRQIAYVFSTFS